MSQAITVGNVQISPKNLDPKTTAKLGLTPSSSGGADTSTVITVNGQRKANPAATLTADDKATISSKYGAQALDMLPKDSTAAPQPPTTPTNTPPTTGQPSPTTANATPYTQAAPAVSDAAAQQNLAVGGLTGSDLTAAQKSLSAYQQGHAAATASGPAPQESGAGMSAATTAVNSASQPDTSGVDNFLATNKEADPVRQIMSQVADLQNSQKNSSTLLQDYKSLYAGSGLDNINEELIHADTVINGTEQDIRNEIQAAGGMGTESQVQAMTLARNKPLLIRYNQLAQMKTDATNQLNSMMSLDAQDKQMAQQRVNTQIDTLYKSADLINSMQNAARTQATQLIQMVGADGLYAALKNDPNKLAYVEQQVGGSTGWMAEAAHNAAQTRSLDVQSKQANIAQSYAAIRASDSAVAKNSADVAATQTAKVQAIQQQATTADTVLTSVSKALKQVNPTSSGFIGGISSAIPSSPSNNLQATITTIKSNLAFTELAKMRAASPTGGALGAISDKEEELLSSTVANLGVNQSSSQLKENLKAVQTHYVNYLTSLGYGYDAATGTVISP